MAEEPLVTRVRAALADAPSTEQRMFGGVCFMLNGNMLVGASKRGLLVRVGKEWHAAAAMRPHASTMEMRGRRMEGYVNVAPEGIAGDAELRSWLALAREHVATLPPKPKRTPTERRRPKG